MVVGAPYDFDGEFFSGAVFVYMEVEDSRWELAGDKITSGVSLTSFGYSVDIDEESRTVIGETVSFLKQLTRHLSHSRNFAYHCTKI